MPHKRLIETAKTFPTNKLPDYGLPEDTRHTPGNISTEHGMTSSLQSATVDAGPGPSTQFSKNHVQIHVSVYEFTYSVCGKRF